MQFSMAAISARGMGITSALSMRVPAGMAASANTPRPRVPVSRTSSSTWMLMAALDLEGLEVDDDKGWVGTAAGQGEGLSAPPGLVLQSVPWIRRGSGSFASAARLNPGHCHEIDIRSGRRYCQRA